MQPNDRQRFAGLMTGIAEMYGKDVSAAGLKLWWAALEGFEFDAVSLAMNRHVQHPDQGQFMPKPADIIRQIEGGADVRSLAAWTKVEVGLSRGGPYKPLAFDDSRIHAVISDMGGWMRFCSAKTSEWPFIQKEFCERYRGYLQNPPERYPALIYGEPGFEHCPPILIGNAGVAQQVMLSGGGSSVLVTESDVKRLTGA